MKTSRNVFAVLSTVLLCFCADLLVPASSWAACAGSSPRWTSTADYASVNSCVSAATAGDTIFVSGNAIWPSTLAITRGVNLVGVGKPTITGAVTLIYWTPDSTAQSAHDTLRIKGFTLDGNHANFGGAGIIRVYNTSATNAVTLVLQYNTIQNIIPSGRAFYLTGRIYGVAASNVFNNVAILGGTYGLDAVSWANQTQAYGVAENFYLEDNTIQFSEDMSGYYGWVESGQGGRIVVRYNTWNFANITTSTNVWDIHGLQSMQSTSGEPNCAYGLPHPACNPTMKVCQQHSTMVAEYYGNKVYNVPAVQEWMRQRGGWLMMFNNSYSAAGSGTTWIGYAETACDSCQDTGSATEHIANTYVWSNLQGVTRIPLTKLFDSCADCATGSPYTITANRDYFTDPAGAFDGTSGTGAGTLAARPSSCTTGVGYWATNQSTSDLTGMVGAKPATPIAGTLYTCTAPNTWTASYTPYTYPHPLTGPFAPQDVQIKK
jgi:hypothetical protein